MDKKLYRSENNRVIAGVCGGLGEYFDIDPVLVRALFVVAALGGGFGLITYAVLWIVIPEDLESDKGEKNETQKQKNIYREAGERRNMGAIILIAFGAIFLFNNFMPHWGMGRLWPFLLIVVGAMLFSRHA